MTKREYYDLLVQSARDGTFPSIRDGSCLYRGPGTKKCAVGLLIPDELYDREMEHYLVTDFPDTLISRILPEGLSLSDLSRIQALHDEFYNSTWNARKFVENLNQLSCFQDLENKREVKNDL